MLASLALVVAVSTTCNPNTTTPKTVEKALSRPSRNNNEEMQLASFATDCSKKSQDPLAARYLLVSAEAFMKVAQSYRGDASAKMFWHYAAFAYGLTQYLVHDPHADASTKSRAQSILRDIQDGP